MRSLGFSFFLKFKVSGVLETVWSLMKKFFKCIGCFVLLTAFGSTTNAATVALLTNLSGPCVRGDIEKVTQAFIQAASQFGFSYDMIDAGCDLKQAVASAQSSVGNGVEFFFVWFTSESQLSAVKSILGKENVPFIQFNSSNTNRTAKAAGAALNAWHTMKSNYSNIDPNELENRFFLDIQGSSQ
jgi:hypothetical protein